MGGVQVSCIALNRNIKLETAEWAAMGPPVLVDRNISLSFQTLQNGEGVGSSPGTCTVFDGGELRFPRASDVYDDADDEYSLYVFSNSNASWFMLWQDVRVLIPIHNQEETSLLLYRNIMSKGNEFPFEHLPGYPNYFAMLFGSTAFRTFFGTAKDFQQGSSPPVRGIRAENMHLVSNCRANTVSHPRP
eukprot:1388636-Pyramimonas_sp.AAC.1